MPARDATAVPTGTARIRGRVVAADGGTPLRRAQVRVSAPEIRVNRMTTTDADGQYEFAELPAGRYTILVSRNGYVTLQFGQQRPFERGRPLEVADGQTLDRIDFGLARGGVIAGRITDEFGEPMAGVRVQAMRYQYLPSGQRQLVPVGNNPFGMISNDLGEFRLYGLMPAAYVVSATPGEDGGGMFVATGGPAVALSADTSGHGLTYYPGTISSDEAQPITVAIAQEAQASFALVPSRMTKVSGVIRNSQGKPVSGVVLGLRSRSFNGMMFSRAFPNIGPDGSFTLTNVPPGEHWLEVLPRGGGDESGSVAISAGDRDITGLVITTTPGVTVQGRVTFDGSSTSGRPTRIVTTSADQAGPAGARGLPDNGTIDPEGRFQIQGAWGRVLFNAVGTGFGPTQGWSIKSVRRGGDDLTDTPLDLGTTGDVSDLEIMITSQQTTLSGSVKNPQGEPVRDYAVVILPESLREGVLPMRFTRVVRPDQQGRFETKGLPAGQYLAVAVHSIDSGGEWDPAFRAQVEPGARRFRLMDGQIVSLDLILTP
jgi:hypothetical protein